MGEFLRSRGESALELLGDARSVIGLARAVILSTYGLSEGESRVPMCVCAHTRRKCILDFTEDQEFNLTPFSPLNGNQNALQNCWVLAFGLCIRLCSVAGRENSET